MRRGMLFLVTLAFVIVVSGATGQGVKKFESKVKIVSVNTTPKRGTHYFHGVVKSDKDACIKQRQVDMYREGAPATLAHLYTNNRGKWTYQIDAFVPGTYYARVSVVTTPSYVCKGDRSNSYVH